MRTRTVSLDVFFSVQHCLSAHIAERSRELGEEETLVEVDDGDAGRPHICRRHSDTPQRVAGR